MSKMFSFLLLLVLSLTVDGISPKELCSTRNCFMCEKILVRKQGGFKDATRLIFSRKMVLSLCKKVILTARHLFRSENSVSKLFGIFIFTTMFMCKTRMSAGKAWLRTAITVSRSQNRKIYVRGNKQDNMTRQSEKLHLFWSSRLGGDRVRKISIFTIFRHKMAIFWTQYQNFKIERLGPLS